MLILSRIYYRFFIDQMIHIFFIFYQIKTSNITNIKKCVIQVIFFFYFVNILIQFIALSCAVKFTIAEKKNKQNHFKFVLLIVSCFLFFY